MECVLSSGKPFDTLKSLCHPAVFNTAITRAQSLVVAVGNPFTLMKAEATLGSSTYCWRQFISTCQNSKTYDESSYLEFTDQHSSSRVSKKPKQLLGKQQQQSQLVTEKSEGSKPVPVKPKEQQPVTTQANGSEQNIAKHGIPCRQLQLAKLKQKHAKVRPLVTKSVTQQVYPDIISQKKPISSDKCVAARSERHNQNRHDTLKQVSKSPNEKKTWEKKPHTSEQKVFSKEAQYRKEFPVSYELITYYTV